MHASNINSSNRDPLEPIPFPRGQSSRPSRFNTNRILDEFDNMSRRMEDLARALHCPGHFSDDDRPRAA